MTYSDPTQLQLLTPIRKKKSPNSGPISLVIQQHIITLLHGSKWSRRVSNMSRNKNGWTLHQMSYVGPYVKRRIGRHQEWT
eukprot:13065465-Ditylum_brightwellii.AAC.1